jgi:cytochrome c-type biogenesis protein CcmH/NrfG
MTENNPTTPDNSDGRGSSLTKLPLPPLRSTFRPAYFFKLVEHWFLSRVPSRILLGLPSAAAAVGGILFLLYLKHDDQQAAIDRYQAALNESLRAEEWDSATLYLNSLCSLRPHVPQYKFQLALLSQQSGNHAAAIGLMHQLAPLTGSAGFAPARMWLVQQTLSGRQLGLTKEQLGQQLKAAVKERPADTSAHQLLANYYVSEKQFRLAETHLREGAEYAPEMYLSLARLQKQLKRGPDLISSSLELARSAFQQQLTKDPGNLNARIQWSRCHALQNDYKEAELILREGLAVQDSPELRIALSQLYVEISSTRLQESPFSAPQAGRLLTESLALAPSNVSAIAQLSNIPAAARTFSETDLKEPLAYWHEQIKNEDNSSARLVLAQLLKLCGQTTEAIEQLEIGLSDHPESRPLLAQLYTIDDRSEEADALYDQLLKELDEQSERPPTELIYARSVLLLQAGRLDKAIAFIRARREDVPELEREALNRVHAGVLDAMVSELLSTDADSSEAAFELLKESNSVAPQEMQALVKLASLSCSTLSAAAQADSLLTTMLTEGTFNASVYNFIGTEALRGSQFQKARRNLETARRLDPQNPMILNNLALVSIRGASPDYDYALSLIKSVLQLLPNHPDALSTRAEILVALERWEEADRDLQLALPDRPTSQNVRRLLIIVNEKLGNQELADRHRDVLRQLQDKAT